MHYHSDKNADLPPGKRSKKDPKAQIFKKKKKNVWNKRRQQWENMKDRFIATTVPDPSFCDNKISTGKYNALTFIPRNLFEQFSKLANVYFLIIGIMQMVNEISLSEGKPVIYLPLSFVVLVSAMKDLFEDLKRHQSDQEENTRNVQVLREKRFEYVHWEDIMVGELVKIQQNEFIPADILIMHCSDKAGVCYIETKNLDGQTNLKRKAAPKELQTKLDYETNPAKFEYEAPNPYLYSFTGTVHIEDENSGILNKVPVDANNFLLRGSSVRNTDFIIGLVSYTGHDTKIMLNSVKARPKRSHVENRMNVYIAMIFGVQLALCLICTIAFILWNNSHEQQLKYLRYDLTPGATETGTVLFVKWGTWVLIFTNFVPISLIVTLEMVKFIQGIFISLDEGTYCTKTDTPCSVQSSNLNEELGQVHYIFSDKTGTLTSNVMKFKCMSIAGKSYGDQEGMAGGNEISEQELKKLPNVTNVDFQDRRIFQDFQRELEESKERDAGMDQNTPIKEALMSVALCHTILAENNSQGVKEYNASSPDELALVNFAQFCGVQYLGSDDQNNMLVKVSSSSGLVEDQVYQYKLLYVLEFNSTRKRMSVILKDEIRNQYILIIKGADTVIQKRLKKGYKTEEKDQTWELLSKYASEGLRTLLLAKRIIKKEVFEEWETRYKVVCSSIENRDLKMQDLQEEIEIDFVIVGATAIEDMLQDQVGETIQYVKKAGIQVWVLTGDQIETAINIGYSCQLLSDFQTQLMIDGVEQDAVKEAIVKAHQGIVDLQQQLQDKPQELAQSSKFLALILSGDALIHCMKTPSVATQVMNIADECESVLACRVSPKQKQQIVTLVRREKPSVTTLAIGDGANDVNMITAAHVGIGIKGVQGAQAARSSDYAIGEFKILRNLLLHHGRESYRKNSILICYNFYKNLMLIIPQLWFGFQSGMSGAAIFDPWIYQLYNLCYTSLPIVVFAIFDEEFQAKQLLINPQLYENGFQGVLFNLRVFLIWIASALLISLYTYLVFMYGQDSIHETKGFMPYMISEGMMMFGGVVYLVNLKVLFISNSHSFGSLFVIYGSMGFFLLNHLIGNSITPSLDLYNTFDTHWESHQFWFAMIVLIVSMIVFELSVSRYFYFQQSSSLFEEGERDSKPLDEIELIQLGKEGNNNNNFDKGNNVGSGGSLKSALEIEDPNHPIFQRRDSIQKSNVYHGYAFSQEEPLSESQKVS